MRRGDYRAGYVDGVAYALDTMAGHDTWKPLRASEPGPYAQGFRRALREHATALAEATEAFDREGCNK